MAVPPTHVPNLFCRDYFSDPANDPFNGDHSNVMDPCSVAENLLAPPATARALACDAKGQGVPAAFNLLNNDGNELHVCTHLDKFSPRMGLSSAHWDDRMLACKGH